MLRAATCLSRRQGKVLVADTDTANVSVEQLRVWATLAGASCARFLGALDSAIDSSPPLLLAPARKPHTTAVHLMVRPGWASGCTHLNWGVFLL